MTESTKFRQAIGYVFTKWTGLQVAIEHGMGGPNAREKEKWMGDVVEDFFLKNDDLQADEVEDFFTEIIDNEFDTLIEDGSANLVAKTLCDYFIRCQKGEDVTQDWSKENEKVDQPASETNVLASRIQDMTLNDPDGWTVVTHKKHK